MKVPFYLHHLGDAEKHAIVEALGDPILSTGARVKDFEERFARFVGAPHALGVTHCTAALHACLLAAGIGEGDEVIVPPLTFIATANAVLHCGGKPVFADVDRDTGNLSPDAVAAAITPRTRAIIPVHLYGTPAEHDAFAALARQHNLTLIYDAAHCVEGQYRGRRIGELGDFTCYSFYATKNLTCGEGGAITLKDEATLERLRRLTLHGMTSGGASRFQGAYKHWDMVELGWKYNLPNVLAALLIPQLERLPGLLEQREAICRQYEEAFAGLGYLRTLKVPAHVRSARHLFTVVFDPAVRDEAIRQLNAAGIGITVNYRPVHLTQYYREALGYREGMYPHAEAIGGGTVSLPLYPRMSPEQVQTVISAVRALRL
ncbi:MAG: DegT/DnrJ/EryC1/StrS aminotransferase family protein [Myxococcota bacterium]